MSDGYVDESLNGDLYLHFAVSIPIVYYGQEQGFAGNADPVSRFT